MHGECLILIRPDGYLGLMSRPIGEAVVLRYLTRFWPRAEACYQQRAMYRPPRRTP